MLVDAHSHVDRYDLVGEDALNSALAEVRKTTAQAITETVHSNLGGLIRNDPWLADVYARFFEDGQPNN